MSSTTQAVFYYGLVGHSGYGIIEVYNMLLCRFLIPLAPSTIRRLRTSSSGGLNLSPLLKSKSPKDRPSSFVSPSMSPSMRRKGIVSYATFVFGKDILCVCTVVVFLV